MTEKHPIHPEKLRRIPEQFSWLDHRLVQHHLIDGCSHASLALYLFLVTVGDRLGLSFYSDKSLCSRLNMAPFDLAQARNELIRAELIAYRKPLYQVLSLTPAAGTSRPGGMESLGQILRRLS